MENFDLDYIMNYKSTIPRCDKCNSIIKPDVVLYEESLNMDVIDKSVEYISKADVFNRWGNISSCIPAAGLIDYFNGKHLILINKQSTPYDKRAEIIIHDSIGKVLNSVL